MVITDDLITEIDTLYDKVYSALYRNDDTYEDYDFDEAMDAGDAFFADEAYKALLKALIERRDDIYSSDREAAAIAITLDKLNIRKIKE